VIEVEGRAYTTSDVDVATGSQPIVPPVPGLRELDGIWTNREATGLREVPCRLLVLGGGAVGVETAQAVARMGASVVLVEGAERLLARMPRPFGKGVAAALALDGIDLRTGVHARPARRSADGDYELELDDGEVLRGDRLLVATGRRPRLPEGLEAVAVEDRMRAGDRLWAVGDVTGIWPLTYVGNYQARVAAANILAGDARATNDAVPRVVFTHPQAAAVGEPDGELVAAVPLSDVARTATYTREYATRPGFLTLVSDGERLTGAAALGPGAGEWLQQATLAIRARVPLNLLRDTTQPFLADAAVDGGALLLTGEPGVGKTALLSATAQTARPAGTWCSGPPACNSRPT
jgi:pyruvate/2-oxoglutarate dehydrogenase complex dihydrolipoamide dehydrogenase (E3) component